MGRMIFFNILLISTSILLWSNPVVAQTCLPGGMTFSTQQQINSFASNYPGCTEVLGYISVRGATRTSITSLNGFSQITKASSINIQDNDALTSLHGLHNLDSLTGGHFRVDQCNGLINLAGVNNLKYVHGQFDIYDNAALTSITGLNGLTALGNKIEILNNPMLSDLSGFSNLTTVNRYFRLHWSNVSNLTGLNSLTSVGGSLTISKCNALTSLTALSNLTSIDGNLGINRTAISSLSGLENIDETTIVDLYLTENYALSICGFQNICNFLNIGGYNIIYYNGNSCNSAADILNTCTFPCSFYPINTTVVNLNCQAICNGIATATATGGIPPYSYEWDTGDISPTVSNLCAGSYTVTTTDANGCVNTATATITSPPLLVLSVQDTSVNCHGMCTGVISAVMTGGVPPYSYDWSTGANSSTVSNLCAGTYLLTTTDANGCTHTATATITEPAAPLSFQVNTIDVSCYNGCDGTISVVSSGGTPPYSYDWNTGANSSTVSNLCAGTYLLTATDANGCTATHSSMLMEPTAALQTTVVTTPVSASGAMDGTAMANATGGTPPYAYLWSNGAITPFASGLAVGLACVTVSDANNCIETTCEAVEISTAVSDNGLLQLMSVFPNPTSGQLTVQVLDQSEDLQLIIYNLVGQPVLRFAQDSPSKNLQHSFDLSNLSNGLYLLELRLGDRVYVERVVKQGG